MRMTLTEFYDPASKARRLIERDAKKHFHTTQIDVIYEHDSWFVNDLKHDQMYAAVLASNSDTDYVAFEEL